jgi:hypothetical protein
MPWYLNVEAGDDTRRVFWAKPQNRMGLSRSEKQRYPNEITISFLWVNP